jgi:hypothetical protein
VLLIGKKIELIGTGSGEGGVSSGGAVPERGIHRDQPDRTVPGRGTVLQQVRHRRAVDQGGEAGGENDAAELPSLSVQQGAAVAEPDRLQLGEPVAAAGDAEEDRQLVAHQPATRLVKTGGRLIKHARYYWLLLAESHLTRPMRAFRCPSP